MPWGLVLLLGGGFAIAKATQISGFSQLLSQELKILEFMDPRLLVIIICVFTAAATEVTSNVATISIILPILRDLVRSNKQFLPKLAALIGLVTFKSLSLRINPLYLMLPTTISCSYAFMLPVATPPNAIVFATSGVMKTIDMVPFVMVAGLLSPLYLYLFSDQMRLLHERDLHWSCLDVHQHICRSHV